MLSQKRCPICSILFMTQSNRRVYCSDPCIEAGRLAKQREYRQSREAKIKRAKTYLARKTSEYTPTRPARNQFHRHFLEFMECNDKYTRDLYGLLRQADPRYVYSLGVIYKVWGFVDYLRHPNVVNAEADMLALALEATEGTMRGHCHICGACSGDSKYCSDSCYIEARSYHLRHRKAQKSVWEAVNG